jgi:hypothetical protein
MSRSDAAANVPYTLWHHTHSLYSLMIRYTLALRGPPKQSLKDWMIKDKRVDIYHMEQLEKKSC